MSYVVTRCPKCSTAFKVTPTQLTAAKGSVRCGSCLSVFKALHHINKPANKVSVQQANKPLVSEVSSAVTPIVSSKSTASPENNSQKTEPAKTQKSNPKRLDIRKRTVNVQDGTETVSIKGNGDKAVNSKLTTSLQKKEGVLEGPVFSNTESSKIEQVAETNHSKTTTDSFVEDNHKNEDDNNEVEHATIGKADFASLQKVNYGKGNLLSTIQPAPVEMVWNEDKLKNGAWLWFFSVVLLTFLIFFQVATFKFQTLSKTEPYRSIYGVICPTLGCVLPDLVDTTKIRVSNLILRSHPSVDDALIIDTILLNLAGFSQPYPDLLLEFRDINDNTIAFRQFYSGEYLGGELAGSKLMPTNQPVQLSIEIVDPGPDAVNYQLYVAHPR